MAHDLVGVVIFNFNTLNLTFQYCTENYCRNVLQRIELWLNNLLFDQHILLFLYSRNSFKIAKLGK